MANGDFTVDDSGNLGSGTMTPRAQLEISGDGAGDWFGCPVMARIHTPPDSDAWSLVMSTGEGAAMSGVVLAVTPNPGNTSVLTFSPYDGQGNVYDGMSLDNAGVHLLGALSVQPLNLTVNYTIQAGDQYVLADAGAGGITITLPNTGSIGAGRLLAILKSAGAGAVTVIPASGGDTINGSTNPKTISTSYSGLRLVSTFGAWVATVMPAA